MERYDYLKVRVVENREVIKSEDTKIERLTPEGIKPELFKYTINGKVGLLNSDGEEITPCIYDDISYIIGDGVLIIPSLNGKEGLLNANGVLTVPCEYNSIRKAQLGNSSKYYKAVKKRGETHIIDRTGKVFASSTADVILISDNIFLDQEVDIYRVVNIENPENNKRISKSGCYFSRDESTFTVRFGEKYGSVSVNMIDNIENWFDEEGNLIIPDVYYAFEQVSENLFSVGKYVNGKMVYGLYDVKTKQEVLAPTYERIHPFSEGLAIFEMRQKVRINGKLEDRNKKGYIDELGNVVIEPIYDVAEDMQNWVARIGIINPTAQKEQYLYGLVHKSGEEKILPEHDRLTRYPKYVEVSSGVKNPKVKMMQYNGSHLTLKEADGEHVIPLEKASECLVYYKNPEFTGHWKGYKFALIGESIGAEYNYVECPDVGDFHVVYYAIRDIDEMLELLYGVLDDNHNVAICPQYSSLISLDNGYFLAGITYRKKVEELYDLGSEVTKWGVIDKTGEVIADFVYDLGDDGRTLVKNGRNYFVDGNGNLCEPYRKVWAEKYIKSSEDLDTDSEYEILEYMSAFELSDGRIFIVSDTDFETYHRKAQEVDERLTKIETSDRYKEYLASLQSLEQQIQSLIRNEISQEFALEMKPKKS